MFFYESFNFIMSKVQIEQEVYLKHNEKKYVSYFKWGF